MAQPSPLPRQAPTAVHATVLTIAKAGPHGDPLAQPSPPPRQRPRRSLGTALTTAKAGPHGGPMAQPWRSPHHRGVAVLNADDGLAGGERLVQPALLCGKARLGDHPGGGGGQQAGAGARRRALDSGPGTPGWERSRGVHIHGKRAAQPWASARPPTAMFAALRPAARGPRSRVGGRRPARGRHNAHTDQHFTQRKQALASPCWPPHRAAGRPRS